MKIIRTMWAEGTKPIADEREVLHAVRTGSGALVIKLWHWIRDADGTDSLWYALGAAWALAALGWVIGQAWWLALVLALAWLLAALKLGQTAPPDKIEKDAGESRDSTPNETGDDSPEPPTDDEFVLGLANLIGTRNGVLLSTVVSHFREAGAPPAWDIPDVRAQCTALGIPVRDRIKVRRSTSIGVHRDGLRAALDAGLQPPGNTSPDPEPATTPEGE